MQVADGNDDETYICASFYWKVYFSIHISAATCFLFSHDLIISISQAVAFALFRIPMTLPLTTHNNCDQFSNKEFSSVFQLTLGNHRHGIVPVPLATSYCHLGYFHVLIFKKSEKLSVLGIP